MYCAMSRIQTIYTYYDMEHKGNDTEEKHKVRRSFFLLQNGKYIKITTRNDGKMR